MANGELCKKCGYQETCHEFQDQRGFTCDGFESEVDHAPGCILHYKEDMCGGDCARFMAVVRERQDWEHVNLLHHTGHLAG